MKIFLDNFHIITTKKIGNPLLLVKIREKTRKVVNVIYFGLMNIEEL
jgi:hypothetical protein